MIICLFRRALFLWHREPRFGDAPGIFLSGVYVSTLVMRRVGSLFALGIGNVQECFFCYQGTISANIPKIVSYDNRR